MDEKIAKYIWGECKKLEGKTIKINNDNMSFIKQSKYAATQYEWLYHCTDSSAFLSILSNKEFWLSNLNDVNDTEEVERIDVPEYKNTYYIASFTYSNNIPNEHWNEYGNMKDGVLIGVKQEWFLKQADFMCDNTVVDDDNFKIYPDNNSALAHAFSRPFYIDSFDFYQVVYDDKLKKI